MGLRRTQKATELLKRKFESVLLYILQLCCLRVLRPAKLGSEIDVFSVTVSDIRFGVQIWP